jgi:hypothetical protein
MQIRQTVATDPSTTDLAPLEALAPQLVLVFASVEHCRNPAFIDGLRARFPGARLAGCSTAGEISADGVGNGGSVITAVRFEQTEVVVVDTTVTDLADSEAAGRRLAAALPAEGLRHALVFGPGVQVNGSALIAGMRAGLPETCTISGGLAADGGRFEETFTVTSAGASPRAVVAVGLYGDHVVLGHGSFHGWAPFGPLRRVTRAEGNLLFELDGEPALEVYKRYLGAYAKDLPGSGLLFPFEVVGADGGRGLIRTILGIDEARGSLLLAGDVAQGGHVRLMHASTDSLVNGAQAAAERAGEAMGAARGDRLAVLVSCVGRKLVMGARVDEEVEAVTEVFGRGCALTGYYSNGEISPLFESRDCRLHNQTMTITQLAEVA